MASQRQVDELREKLAYQETVEHELRQRIQFLEETMWGAARIVQRLRLLKEKVCPKGTTRDKLLQACVRAYRARQQRNLEQRRFCPPFATARSNRLKMHEIALACLRHEIDELGETPRISLLMVVDQHAPTERVAATVESLRGQIYLHWELLIGCPPALADALRRQEGAADERVRIVALRDDSVAAGWGRLLEGSTGAFVGVIDAGDRLEPHGLFEVACLLNRDAQCDLLYSDEDYFDERWRYNAFYKPDWSPDLLLNMNYLGRLWLVRTTLVREVGGFRDLNAPVCEYDLLLRVSERSRSVGHVRAPIYSRPFTPEASAFPTDDPQMRQVLRDAVERQNLRAEVQPGLLPGTWHVRRAIDGAPRISIIIPTLGKLRYLKQCIDSIREHSTYRNYEIVIVDNSKSARCEAADYLEAMGCTIVKWPAPFNWSQENNVGAARATGEYLLFLNDDIEIHSPDWLEQMLEHAQDLEVGVVGARLVYANNTIQHAGIFINEGEVAYGHAFRGAPVDFPGYFGFNLVERNCIAVTGACILVSRRVFEQLGGFDESLATTLNDVDFCLRAWQQGLRVVYTPHALLCHHEMISRKTVPMNADTTRYWSRWYRVHQQGDPFYNPHLKIDAEDFSFAKEPTAYEKLYYWLMPKQSRMVDPVSYTPATPCGNYLRDGQEAALRQPEATVPSGAGR